MLVGLAALGPAKAADVTLDALLLERRLAEQAPVLPDVRESDECCDDYSAGALHISVIS